MYLSREEEYSKILGFISNIEYNIEKIKEPMKYNDKTNLNNKTINLINRISLELKSNKESIDELKSPFILFIVGSGNYGKSTLVNLLLNQNIVKTTDLPNTWKLDLFIKSNIEKIQINYEDNSIDIKSFKEGNELLQNEEYKFKESKRRVSNIVKEYKSLKSVDIETLKEYKEEQEKNYLYKSKITQVKYFIKNEGILNNFIIVDTPGLNQSLLKSTQDSMNDYYIKADGVIWLVDAQNLVSKESNKLIDEINKIDSLGNNGKNKIVVINKMDLIKKYNYESIHKVKEKAYILYENKFSDLVFISAKQGIEGLMKKDYNLIKESNINTLFKSIEENFIKVSTEKQILSKYKNIDLMKLNIIKEINIYKRYLYKDIGLYNEIEFQLKEKSEKLKSYVKSYMESLSNNIYANRSYIDNLEKSVIDLEKRCNLDLNEIYSYVYEKCSNYENINAKKINIKIYFSKSKNLVFNTELNYTKHKESINYRENLFTNIMSRNLNIKSYDEIYIKNLIYKKIKNLSEEIIIAIDEKLYLIKENINTIKEDYFKYMYLGYPCIKEHIEVLNDIENIFIKLR